MAQRIDLTFQGYWRKPEVPAAAGIYLVYACTYSQAQNTISSMRLLYIGESTNAHDRIQSHEKWEDWNRQLRSGEQVWFSFAPVTSPVRERAEAALIHHHKPPVNTEYKDNFPFETTTVVSGGKPVLIDSPITVVRSLV